MQIIAVYLSILGTLVLLDEIWLGILTKNFYKQHLNHILRGGLVWPALAAFYLLYAVSVYVFAVTPSEGEWTKAALFGLLLGITAYGTYDLVNFATVKQWPLIVVIVDMAWGAFITICAAVVGALIS